MLAPIALFTYNRPEHTLRTLQALRANESASGSLLYVFCDGPKPNASDADLKSIQKVKEVVNREKWCGDIKIIESNRNRGLADSIVQGVTDVLNRHGKIIVLEDDIITSPGFLNYMNQALNLYEEDDQVMHISGYWFPVKDTHRLPETFFYTPSSCWGWGTWQSSWKLLELDSAKLKDRIMSEPEGEHRFNIEGAYGFMDQLERNINGVIKTWAVKWYATIFLLNGLSLHPNKSFTKNIGFDGTGENCSDYDHYKNDDLNAGISLAKISLVEDKLSRRLFKEYCDYSSVPQKRDKRTTLRKIVDRLYKNYFC